jgi:lipopolysaccharide heptosyltransferase II
MRKVLVVNLNWLGDVLFSIPALKAIKKAQPDIFLAVALPKRCRRILEFNPLIDEIIEFDERNQHRSLKAKLKFISEVRRKKFDKVIFLHRSSTRVIIFTLCGIPNREGYCRRKTRLLMTKCIPDPGKDSMHKARYYLNLVNNLGYPHRDLSYEFYVPDEEIKNALQMLMQLNIDVNNKIICLHPGANWTPKMWPRDHYVRLINLISDWMPEINFLIIGTQKETPLAKYIIENSNYKNIYDLTGKTTLGTLGGVFLFTDIMISGDSGPLHICCAVQIPDDKKYKKPLAIGLYGPTSRHLTGPLNGNFIILEGKRKKNCLLPCYNFKCQDHQCIYSITPQMVFETIKKHLSM